MKTWQKLKVHPELIEKYLIREKVVDTIRYFFKARGFHEVSTPILVPVPSAESNLEVFETELKTLSGKKRRGFLIMSPEYSLKKLLSAGLGSIFEITKSFRNEEEVSRSHNPEFTMLEWYRVGADYHAVMKDFEELFTAIISKTCGRNKVADFSYQGETYDLSTPWVKISVKDAFKNFAGIDTETLVDNDLLIKAGANKGLNVDDSTTWEQVFYQIFYNEIEPKLKSMKKPVFIYDYPLSQAALAKKSSLDPRFAERFEIYLAGLELGNCFSELTDPLEQKSRFEEDLNLRKLNQKTEYPMDEDLIEALAAGMPEVSGIAVGVDRLVMLAADLDNLSDSLFFPAQELFDL